MFDNCSLSILFYAFLTSVCATPIDPYGVLSTAPDYQPPEAFVFSELSLQDSLNPITSADPTQICHVVEDSSLAQRDITTTIPENNPLDNTSTYSDSTNSDDFIVNADTFIASGNYISHGSTNACPAKLNALTAKDLCPDSPDALCCVGEGEKSRPHPGREIWNRGFNNHLLDSVTGQKNSRPLPRIKKYYDYHDCSSCKKFPFSDIGIFLL